MGVTTVVVNINHSFSVPAVGVASQATQAVGVWRRNLPGVFMCSWAVHVRNLSVFLTKFMPYLRDNRKKGQGVNFAQKS